MSPLRSVLATVMLASAACAGRSGQPEGASEGASAVASSAVVDQVQRRAFAYLWENCDPRLGLVLDRQQNRNPGQPDLAYSPCSVAAVGFALSALPIAVERGWVTREAAQERALVTLRTFRDGGVESARGFYYHFVDARTGRRSWKCELSSIDTALFVAGALTSASYFGDQVEALARELYARVEWDWMLDGGQTFSMGWTPEGSFLPSRWGHYDEGSILYLLGIGAPAHAIPPASWRAVERDVGEYAGHVCLVSGPLFTHQFSQLWLDLRGKTDGIADYWRSSVEATRANRAFCADNASEYRTYGAGLWGITASDGPDGYLAYSAPPGKALQDGTVAPTAALGSFQFTPELSLAALEALQAVPSL